MTAIVPLLLCLACGADQTSAPVLLQALDPTSLGSILGPRFVSVGTSITMGTRDGGVVFSGQRTAWPAQLAEQAGVPFTVPEIQSPGCPVPLALPLSTLLNADGTSVFGPLTCAPLRSGITLPTQDLAIQNALTSDALFTTPELAAAFRRFRGMLYSRVLPPNTTQVGAMVASHPTFVSVELGGVEVVQVAAGNGTVPMPESEWEPLFDQVIAAVQATGARAVLVGFWNDLGVLPGFRSGAEVYAKRGQLEERQISVSPDCGMGDADNLVYVANVVPELYAEAQAAVAEGRPGPTLSCHDLPGEVDNVVTPAELATLNARMQVTNGYIEAAAQAHGYAYFTLDAVFALDKPEFSVGRLLDSSTPFGSYFSADGIHPSERGHAVLASAAAQAILRAYAPVAAVRGGAGDR